MTGPVVATTVIPDAVDTDALAAFTNGRLAASSDETEAILLRAQAAARRYCGWHVCPVVESHAITVDGPGGCVLDLPTMALIELVSLAEDGVELDVDTELLPPSRLGLIRKINGGQWSDSYGAIECVIDHGLTLAEAADWTGAVLALADRMALSVGYAAMASSMTAGPFSIAGLNSSAVMGSEMVPADIACRLAPFRLDGLA